MIHLTRTDSDHAGFRKLIPLLDAELRSYNGELDAFFAQYNKIDHIKHVIVAFADETAVGCGAIKQYEGRTAEVKRMYVLPEFRGQGIAVQVLNELENWARELNFSELILETGKAMNPAVRLYRKSGYLTIPNYGQYAGVETSVCMKKLLD
jgi:putative acetyltransferase